MKKMVLQQLLLKQKRNALICEQANLIANKLILEPVHNLFNNKAMKARLVN